VADLSTLGRVYRYNALTNSHVFEVMSGGSNLAGFTLTEEGRQHGRYTLSTVVECADRCVAANRFTSADPVLIAHQTWIGVHGTTVLELGRYLIPPYDRNILTRSTPRVIQTLNSWTPRTASACAPSTDLF